jgi:hypothetical protein
MSYQAIQGIPLEIDLNLAGRSTGWTLEGLIATHESCNAGYLNAIGLNLTNGISYTVTFVVVSISGGLLRVDIGDTQSANITTSGFKSVILESSGDAQLKFYSNANCVIELLNIRSNEVITSETQDNTLAFSTKVGKWTSFYNFSPDDGQSLFTNLYTYRNGVTYVHNPFNTSKAYIYGNQYTPILTATFNQSPLVVKMFQSINMKSGCLVITNANGIETSIGQVSELAEIDFLQSTLVDGPTEIKVYDKDGIYLARFLRDVGTGNLYDGDLLKGNYITIEFLATDPDTFKLMSVSVKSVPSIMNVR